MTSKSPEDKANFLSRITYMYFNPLLKIGRRKTIEKQDLYDLSTSNQAETLANLFDQHWQTEVDSGKYNIYRAIYRVCRREIILSALFRFLGDQIVVASPLLLQQIIISIAATQLALNPPPVYEGYLWAVGLFLFQILQSLFLNQSIERSMRIGTLMRTACITAVYGKSLKIRLRAEVTTGQILNIMSTDISRLDFSWAFQHLVWSGPLQMVVAVGYLIWVLGPCALVGFGVMLLTIPAQWYASNKLGKYRKQASVTSDSRVKATQEILTGIKVIKLYSWQEPFIKMIDAIRMKELRAIGGILMVRAIVAGFLQTVPILAAIASFVVYVVAQGYTLNAQIAFTALSLFYTLRVPMLVYPTCLSQFIDAKIALNRIKALLMVPEISNPPVRLEGEAADKSEFAVKVDGASFSWNTTENQLKDVTMHVKKGQLVAIVGTVGSGKSSLLNGLIGEMSRTAGTIEIAGSMGYCAQSAWIQNMTVKDNILFGHEFDEEKYQRVLMVCCLLDDLKTFAAGDQTEIGERGINLSGGQKQRVNLARAVYAGCDIILMDDPLSALDSHVGLDVHNNCIMKELAGKTRLLVTHRLNVLSDCDQIIVLDQGKVVQQGTFKDLMADTENMLAKMMVDVEVSGNGKDKPVMKHPSLKRLDGDKTVEAKKPAQSKLMVEEEISTGQISAKAYTECIRLCGGWIVFMLCLSFMVTAQCSRLVNDLWLNYWINQTFKQLSRDEYIMIYAVLGFVQSILMMMVGIRFVLSTIRASRKVHSEMLGKVLDTPMSFFDTQPLGRILNRFSRDLDTVDSLLADSWRVFWYCFTMTMSVLILVAVVFPYFLAVLIPTIVLFVLFQRYYRNTSVGLKRLDNVNRSPVYALFSESLTSAGLASIRAYGVQKRFIDTNKKLLDQNNQSYYLSVIVQRWLSVRLEFLASVLILAASLFSVGNARNLAPALAGLVITYTLQASFVSNWCIKTFSELEMYMSSVERLENYLNRLENENLVLSPQPEAGKGKDPIELKQVVVKPGSNWPQHGKIEFKDLRLRYRDGLPEVLKGINLSVAPGSKVGIVGRSGAGKSSIVYALFMLTKIGGQILIDDVDITTVDLKELRRKLSILPQDPVIWSGVLRTNLDPFNNHTDEEIWSVLEKCSLKFETLQAEISENGENLSAGQRQLICMARAMLVQSKILILDEATASIDLKTDAFIQKSLRTHFSQCTILSIAHRLSTILDYDQVVVIGDGKVLEQGTPKQLLEKKNYFYKMCIDQDAVRNIEGKIVETPPQEVNDDEYFKQ